MPESSEVFYPYCFTFRQSVLINHLFFVYGASKIAAMGITHFSGVFVGRITRFSELTKPVTDYENWSYFTDRIKLQLPHFNQIKTASQGFLGGGFYTDIQLKTLSRRIEVFILLFN